MTTRVARTLAVLGIGTSAVLTLLGHDGVAAASKQSSVTQASKAPTDKPGTAVILGRVIVDGTSTPVPNSSVCMWATPTGPGNVPQYCEMTDEKGRFLYTNVRAARYNVVAEPGGFARGAYGQTYTEGPARLLDVADGARLMDVTISVYRPAALSGVVLDEAGEPVVGVTVKAGLRRPSVRPIGPWIYAYAGPTVQTDDRGRYRIPVGAGGDFIVVVLSSAFAMVAPGSDPSEAPVIEGGGGPPRPTDVAGPALLMEGLYLRLASGVRPAPLPPPNLGTPRTTYVYPATFHPASQTVAEATIVHVAPGEERRGIDVHLSLARGVRVSGVVTNPLGSAKGLTVRIRPHYAREVVVGDGFECALALTDSAGHFTLVGVPEGDYVVSVVNAMAPAAAGTPSSSIEAGDGRALSMSVNPARWQTDMSSGMANVSVGDRDIDDVQLAVRSGRSITGDLRFDGATQPAVATVARISVGLFGMDNITRLFGATNPKDGHFTTARLPPGDYDFNMAPLSGWMIRSVMWHGHDLTYRAINLDGDDLEDLIVTFTDRVSSLSGTVRGESGLDPDTFVVAFPADYRSQPPYSDSVPFKAVRAGADGRYELTALHSTDYFVAAIDDKLSANWLDPAFLDKLVPLATRVVVTEGAKLVQDLHRVKPR